MDTFLLENEELESREKSIIDLIKNAEIEQIRNNGERKNSPANLFGVFISVHRQRLSLSRNELSDRTAIPVEDLYEVEIGKAPFEKVIGFLPKLSQELGIDSSILSNILLSWVL